MELDVLERDTAGLGTQTQTSRFRVGQPVPGQSDLSHRQAILHQVHDQVLTEQVCQLELLGDFCRFFGILILVDYLDIVSYIKLPPI